MGFYTAFLTITTLVAFASNSILCRLALASASIGATEFTIVRLSAGAGVLIPFLILRQTREKGASGGEIWLTKTRMAQALSLFFYAFFFSYSYVALPTATGALILFASIQISMIGISVYRSGRLSKVEVVGCLLASAGLIYLLLPRISAPPPGSALLMILAGVSWGVYSLLGRNERNPVYSTALNFSLCLPLCLLLGATLFFPSIHTGSWTSRGVILACVSGAITSGLGYVLWYATLRRISTTVAAVVQLAVPPIAALGGMLTLHENMSMHQLWATFAILGGIAVTIRGNRSIPIKR